MRRYVLLAALAALLLSACATNANMQLASDDETPAQNNGSNGSDGGGVGGIFGFDLSQGSDGSGDSGSGGDTSGDSGSSGDSNSSGGGSGSGGNSDPGSAFAFGNTDVVPADVDPNSEFCRQALEVMDSMASSFSEGTQTDPLKGINAFGDALIKLSKSAPSEIRSDMRRLGTELATISLLNFQQKQGIFEGEEFSAVMSYIAGCGVS